MEVHGVGAAPKLVAVGEVALLRAEAAAVARQAGVEAAAVAHQAGVEAAAVARQAGVEAAAVARQVEAVVGCQTQNRGVGGVAAQSPGPKKVARLLVPVQVGGPAPRQAKPVNQPEVRAPVGAVAEATAATIRAR